MRTDIKQEELIRVASFNGIELYRIKTEKFKTNSINIFFHDSLRKETAAKNALLPAVLRRGCERFPTFQEIALYLEELYGAVFDCGVIKKGERQIMHFYIDHISDRYTGDSPGLFEKAFDLLFDIITRPVLVDGVFKKDYVEQEKENLRKLIEGRINDKINYAIDRCYEEMCRDEPFGVHEYGSVEDIASIDSRSLYEQYVKMLENMPVSIFITGDIDDEKLQPVINRLSTWKRGSVQRIEKIDVRKDVREVKNVTDKMDVTQGKLCMGFRTNTAADDKDYYALAVYNGILGMGGAMHSKLFQNVREKASLAYYIFSWLEQFKGLMVISCGIEIQNKDKAIDIINSQMEDIRNGKITDYEYEATLKTLETGIKSLRDSQMNMVNFYLNQTVANTDDTLDSIIEKFKKVTRQDIMDVAQKIKLDTIYFLTSNQV